MRIRRFLTALAAATAIAACSSLDVTNPNQQSSGSFWQTADDAHRGLTAAYNSLLPNGTFGRWQAFANDVRSDIATTALSGSGDLDAFGRFLLNDYNFEVNRELWTHNYELVNRANLVIAHVPGISMDPIERDAIVGEAKFLRALAYYNLVTLYENVPLITSPPSPTDRFPAAAPAETWAQIEKDLVEAAAALPEERPDNESGRATKGAALAMLGRARMQWAGTMNNTAKWGEAATALGQVIAANHYSLLPDYADNFREVRDNRNPESLFEVETEDQYPIITGLSFPKMIGPCYRPAGGLPNYDPTYCDGRPTRWYFDQFAASRTTSGGVDPRMDVTLMYKRADRATERVFGKDRAFYFVDVTGPGSPAREDTMIFFRKYGEWETRDDQRWDNPINYKVIRYADVLLMQAEALNESGQTGQAFQYINQVRARAQKSALAGLSTVQLRDTILFERMFELGLEASRFNDLRRHNLLTPALVAHDKDFLTFESGKSERLPIPTNERNLNPAIQQNPGW